MKFSFKEEKNGKSSFLDVEVSLEGNKFPTIVYQKPTLNGVYKHFDSFLRTINKFGVGFQVFFYSFQLN